MVQADGRKHQILRNLLYFYHAKKAKMLKKKQKKRVPAIIVGFEGVRSVKSESFWTEKCCLTSVAALVL